MVTRKATAAVMGVTAVTTAGVGFLPLHAAFALAGQNWFAWVDAAGLDAIVLACTVLVVTGRWSWSAWAVIGLSVPVQLAAIGAPAYPWLAAVVALWPLAATLLGCATFLRYAHPLDTTEPTQ